jgi:hypothetical protein
VEAEAKRLFGRSPIFSSFPSDKARSQALLVRLLPKSGVGASGAVRTPDASGAVRTPDAAEERRIIRELLPNRDEMLRACRDDAPLRGRVRRDLEERAWELLLNADVGGHPRANARRAVDRLVPWR